MEKDKTKEVKRTTGVLTMERMDNRNLNSVGSSRIRMRWPLNYWPEAEEYVIGKEYDILIFQKVYWDNMMRNFRGVKILDLCDPDWLEGKPVFEFIDLCDTVTTSTEPLAEYIRKMRPKAFVQCVPDRVYIPEHKPIKEIHKGPLRKVCWFGYQGNTHYLMNTFDELINRDIELTIISNATYDPPLAYREKLNIKNVAYDYNTLFKELIKADAVLMPDPHGDEKSKYKSNNKTTESWALGMPVIRLPGDIDKFMSADTRRKESRRVLQDVKENWDVKDSVEDYRNIIEEVKKRRVKE